MKTNIATLFTGLAALGTLGACSTTNQLGQTQLGDVDPMYAQYRTPVAAPIALNETVTADYSKGDYQFQDESLSSKTVNPDLVAQYQNGDQRSDEGQASDDYYVEEYNRPGAYGNQPQTVNNFYGNPNRFSTFGSPFYGGGFYDPFFDPFSPFNDPFWGPGMGMGFGSPWAQPWGRPGFNVGLSFGWGMGGWGNPYGFNRWNRFDRFGGYGGFYDPFWGPSMAYGGWGRGMGGWGQPGWGMGGFYGRPNVIVVNNGVENNYRTPYTRGTTNQVVSRNGQRSNYSRDNRLVRSNSSTKSANSSRGRVNTASRNEAYNAPRASQSTTSSRRSSRTYVPQTNRSAASSANRSQSTRSRDYSRQSGSSRNYSNSPSRSSSYGTSRGSGNSRSYGNSSRSSGSSYGSRSSGSSYSRSSSGSSSSGSYSRGSSSSSGSSRGGSRGRP